jgi:hypothetical protein
LTFYAPVRSSCSAPSLIVLISTVALIRTLHLLISPLPASLPRYWYTRINHPQSVAAPPPSKARHEYWPLDIRETPERPPSSLSIERNCCAVTNAVPAYLYRPRTAQREIMIPDAETCRKLGLPMPLLFANVLLPPSANRRWAYHKSTTKTQHPNCLPILRSASSSDSQRGGVPCRKCAIVKLFSIPEECDTCGMLFRRVGSSSHNSSSDSSTTLSISLIAINNMKLFVSPVRSYSRLISNPGLVPPPSREPRRLPCASGAGRDIIRIHLPIDRRADSKSFKRAKTRGSMAAVAKKNSLEVETCSKLAVAERDREQ